MLKNVFLGYTFYMQTKHSYYALSLYAGGIILVRNVKNNRVIQMEAYEKLAVKYIHWDLITEAITYRDWRSTDPNEVSLTNE